jgi:hypothetical protein
LPNGKRDVKPESSKFSVIYGQPFSGKHLIRPAATFSPADAEKGWQWRHPREMGAAEVVAFLNHLAGVEHVAAATQNQVKKGQSKAR